MTTSKTIAALLGPTLIATAVSLLANLDTSQTLIEGLSHSPALIMIAGYAAFVPGLAIVYSHNRDAQLASAGDRDGMAIACRSGALPIRASSTSSATSSSPPVRSLQPRSALLSKSYLSCLQPGVASS